MLLKGHLMNELDNEVFKKAIDQSLGVHVSIICRIYGCDVPYF